MDRDVHLILIDHWRDTEWLGSRRICFGKHHPTSAGGCLLAVHRDHRELTATSLLCRYGMSKGGHSSLVFIRNASFSVWWSDFPSTPSNMALFWLCTFSVTTPKKRSAAMAAAGT